MKALMTEEEHMIFERMEKEGLMPCYVGGKDYVVKRISCLKADTFLEISTSHFWYDADEVKHYLVDVGGKYDQIPTPFYMTLEEYIAKCKELT